MHLSVWHDAIHEPSALPIRACDEQGTRRITLRHRTFDAVFFPTQQADCCHGWIWRRGWQRLIASLPLPRGGILPRHLKHRTLLCELRTSFHTANLRCFRKSGQAEVALHVARCFVTHLLMGCVPLALPVLPICRKRWQSQWHTSKDV